MWGSAGAESPVNCREPGGVWGILEVSGWDEESAPEMLACKRGVSRRLFRRVTDQCVSRSPRSVGRIPQTPPGGRQLAKIPLLVIDLPASADAFAKGIINPLDGAFGVPVADIGPHGIVALVEGLDAIEVAVALPHREDRSPEGLED